MSDHYKTHEFEALQLRYEDQVVLLRNLTEIDHRIVTAIFTLQLALGGWLVTQDPLDPPMQWGIAIIDLAVACILSVLLFFNHKRRQEVVATIKNLNDALGFGKAGVYLVGRALNPTTKRRYWFCWYIGAIAVTLLALFFVIFRASFTPLVLQCEVSGSTAFGIRLERFGSGAGLIVDLETVPGEASKSVDHFKLTFPASQGRLETHIGIVRSNGAMTWEHGTAPFGAASGKNVFRSGECHRIESKDEL